jgi:hypothetical protein
MPFQKLTDTKNLTNVKHNEDCRYESSSSSSTASPASTSPAAKQKIMRKVLQHIAQRRKDHPEHET